MNAKSFISRELGHHWSELQLVSDVRLINKGRAQSLKEFAASSCRAILSSGSVRGGGNRARTLFSKKPYKGSMVLRSGN